MNGISLEQVLWLTLLLLGMLSRLLFLGATPLNDAEAQSALAALSLARGEAAILFNPFLGGLQSVLYFLFGPSDVGARLPAAFFGTLLPLAPWLARHQLGQLRALFFGVLLALSPTLCFDSRLVTGGAAAWLFALCLYLLMGQSSDLMIGALGGALLACGNSAFLPLLALLAALIVSGNFSLLRGSITPRCGIAAAVFLLVCSTVFGANLSGLGSAFGGLAQGAQLLFNPSLPQLALPASRLLAGLGLYEIIVILTGVAGLAVLTVSSQKRAANRGWLAWILVCGVACALPGRSTHSASGLILGLCALASLALASLIQGVRQDGQRHGLGFPLSVAGLSWMIGLFACVSALQFASQSGAMAILSFGVAGLAIAGVCLLYSANAPGAVPVRGALCGLAALAITFGQGMGLNLNFNRANNPGEPYVTSAASDDLAQLRARLERIGTLAMGDVTALPLSVDDSAPPALRWAIRDLGDTRFSALPSNEGALLLPEKTEFRDSNAYLGDVFNITGRASLTQLNCKQIGDKNDCSEYAQWLVQRKLDAVEKTPWVLWIRSDVAAQLSGKR